MSTTSITIGTINIVIPVVSEHGLAVGVDSRCSEKRQTGPSDFYTHVLSDDNEKFKDLGNGICITACYNKSRNEELWAYLEGQRPQDVEEAAILAEKYLLDHPVASEEKGCEVFLAGPSRGNVKEYFIYHGGDGRQMMRKKGGKSYLIGHGNAIARKSMGQFSSRLTKDAAIDLVYRTLVHTGLGDPTCGGNLNVNWMAEGRIDCVINNKPFIDAMIELGIPKFEGEHLLLFSKYPYEDVNHSKLEDHFEGINHDYLVDTPSFLGEIVRDWNCFLVNWLDADNFFETGCKSSRQFDDKYFRYFILEKTTKAILVMKPSSDMLKKVRNDGILK